MKEKISYRCYRIIRWFVRLFYPKITAHGTENLPEDEAFIAVGNHCKMNGPICCELYFPVERYTWCAGEMMDLKDVPAYAFQDFWSNKPAYNRWFFRILSYLIAPVSVCVFNNANCIGVYHGARVMSTFRTTVDKLAQGKSVVIFPEHNVPYNDILCEFRERYTDVARMYNKKTGKDICFVPLYIAPALKGMYFGRPVRFDSSAPKDEERKRINKYLMEEITDIAKALPKHMVVPYPNIPKKEYPVNRK